MFTLKVNGASVQLEVADITPLLFVLRNDLKLKGAKFGCGAGFCGACTVLADGRAIQSCTTPVWSVDNAEITTIEGLVNSANGLDSVCSAFVEEQAAQCGFCIPGIVMTIKSLLLNGKPLSVDAISGLLAERHLCRCGTHQRILKAAHRALDCLL